MKKFLKNFAIALAISIPLVLTVLYIDNKTENNFFFKFEKPKTEQDYKKFSPLNLDTEIENLESLNQTDSECTTCGTEIENIEIHQVQHIAWIPSWDYRNAINSLNSFETTFHSISPVTFQIESDGNIKPRLDVNLNELKNQNYKLVPTISNFDWNIMKSIFDSPENTQRHINSIVQAVKTYNYDGIDLDYESLKTENKEHFLNFVSNLSTELHKENKILSVTVFPQWGDDIFYTGYAETRNVQDWAYIGRHADQVRIMTYDYTPPASKVEGPIAPIDWMEKVLKYAVEKIPREKIWLGVHLYAYEWVMPTKDSKDMVTKTNAYTYNTVKNSILIHEYVKSQHNAQFQEGIAEYQCAGSNYCILYYQNPEGMEARVNLAEKYKIAGLAYWRLGGEGELIK